MAKKLSEDDLKKAKDAIQLLIDAVPSTSTSLPHSKPHLTRANIIGTHVSHMTEGGGAIIGDYAIDHEINRFYNRSRNRSWNRLENRLGNRFSMCVRGTLILSQTAFHILLL